MELFYVHVLGIQIDPRHDVIITNTRLLLREVRRNLLCRLAIESWCSSWGAALYTGHHTRNIHAAVLLYRLVYLAQYCSTWLVRISTPQTSAYTVLTRNLSVGNLPSWTPTEHRYCQYWGRAFSPRWQTSFRHGSLWCTRCCRALLDILTHHSDFEFSGSLLEEMAHQTQILHTPSIKNRLSFADDKVYTW